MPLPIDIPTARAPAVKIDFPVREFQNIAQALGSMYSRYNQSGVSFGPPERIYGPAEISNPASAVIYTVAAGRRYRVDLITIVNATAGIVQVDLSLNGAPAAATRIFQSLVAANSAVYVEGPIILNATDTLRAMAGAAGLSITVQGQRIL